MIELAALIGFAIGVVALFSGIVWLAERTAKAELKKEQRDDELRRLRDAIEADARGRERIARGELLQDDGYKRN